MPGENTGPNPCGLCMCGCGGKTSLSPRGDTKRSYVRGKPMRYIIGHSTRNKGPDWIEEDRGYKTPCWIWQLFVDPDHGYGMCNRGGSGMRAHRWVYIDLVGPIRDGMELDHLCRVKACVNPSHLEPVTHAENVQRGNVATLTRDQVDEIRASDATNSELALRYGVNRSYVWALRRGTTWKDAA